MKLTSIVALVFCCTCPLSQANSCFTFALRVQAVMCWNIQFSLLSAVVGWVTCVFLCIRNYSERDRWYAKYLVTYTFTQLVDIALWSQHYSLPNGLQGCSSLEEQFGSFPEGALADQYWQFVISKFAIPVVVLTQYYFCLTYPSDSLKNHRGKLIGVHALATLGMGFQFACSRIMQANFPLPHETLIWGGVQAPTWQVLIVVVIQSLDFALVIPQPSVRLVHIGTFLTVVSFLWLTEGTLSLGSKWCTYCLIFSVSYATDPWWGPGPWKGQEVTKNGAGDKKSR